MQPGESRDRQERLARPARPAGPRDHRRRQQCARLLVGFSIVGSLLTLVSIYGVLSLSVASRRRELAIRSALWRAARGHLILNEAGRLIAGGVVAGIVLAFVLARALRSFLFDVEPADPWMLVGASVLFAAIGLAACWMPTRRAAAVDTLEALRAE